MCVHASMSIYNMCMYTGNGTRTSSSYRSRSNNNYKNIGLIVIIINEPNKILAVIPNTFLTFPFGDRAY